MASWCKPCQMLTPILKRISNPETKADVDLVTVDTDSEDGSKLLYEHRASSLSNCECRFNWLQVRAMPTVVAFRNGVEVGRFVGALPEHEVESFVNKAQLSE